VVYLSRSLNTKRSLGVQKLALIATEREELLYLTYGVKVKELEGKVLEKKK
jgi:hypothetical protein